MREQAGTKKPPVPKKRLNPKLNIADLLGAADSDRISCQITNLLIQNGQGVGLV
jgi:hypothetical protein